MSSLSYVSTDSNPKQETSYNAQACGHARRRSDAVTYGGKCVAQRKSTVCEARKENWRSRLWFLSVILDAFSLIPGSKVNIGIKALLSLSDSAGCAVSAHVCSSGGAVMQLRNKYSNRQE